MIENLAQPNPDWQSTGAVFRDDDPRDHHLEFLPEVAEAIEAGVPPSFSVVEPGQMPFIMDQNGKSACCPFSICGAKSIEDFGDIKRWNQYDAFQMYADLGGTGPNGIAADPALRYARDIGCRTSDNKRYRIGSYMFAPRRYGEWRNTLAAALVSSGPCVVAALLPSTFGWESSGSMTSGYHQMCLVGYEGLADNDYAVLLNSWGSWWGNQGFCRIKWGYLEDSGDFQSNHVYGAKMVDITDWVPPDPEPEPVPIPPNPNKPPVLLKAKYKLGRKLVLTGDNFAEGALVFVDGSQVPARWMGSDWMIAKRLSLSAGEHTVSMQNTASGQSSGLTFQVEGG